MHGQKCTRNPLGRNGEKSWDFPTFILGTAVCRNIPAEVYGTLCQRLAITGLLVFKGLLHQNMMSPMSPLPTAAGYLKDKIHSGASVGEHTFTCMYHLCKLLPIKRKLAQKLNIKTHKGRKKGSFPPTALKTLLPCRPQREGSAYAEASGAQSPQGTRLSELLLNLTK